MTKYTSNEQYEKDKAALIEYCESPMAKLGYHSQQKIDELANLLKQSEWVGAKSQMLAEIYCLADDIAQDLDYNNEYCSSRANEAIGQAILKAFKIMELIDDG